MEKMALSLPSGIVLPFAGTVEPAGFLFCDGRTLSRAAYPGLFATIGTAHGAPDGNTFNIPDYRGRFLRGVSGATTLDPDKNNRTAMATGGATGNNVGSVQGHAFQTHTHVQNSHSHKLYKSENANQNLGAPGNLTSATYVASCNGYGSISVNYAAMAASGTPDVGLSEYHTATNQNASASGANAQATANETRPTNAYVNYIIKV